MSGAEVPAEPVDVQVSHQMSLLLVPTDGETLPPLNHEDDYYVVRVYLSGVKQTVVERKDNIISREEALQHEEACNQAMLDELKRWLNLGAFERVSKKHASNVIDARWVFKWKQVDDKWRIQARLVVRGFRGPSGVTAVNVRGNDVSLVRTLDQQRGGAEGLGFSPLPPLLVSPADARKIAHPLESAHMH